MEKPATILSNILWQMVLIISLWLICLCSAAAQETEQITLHALLEDHPTVQVMAKLLPEFESRTGIHVNIEVIPFEPMTRKARETLNSRSSMYDVYMDGWVHAVEWAADGHLEPLDRYINTPGPEAFTTREDFIEAYIKDAVLDGQLYGLPVYGESTFLFYRKDLFDACNIPLPETMKDLERAAGLIRERCEGVYPVTLRGREGVHIVYAWATFLWAFGGRWLDENGRPDLDTPEAIQAARFFTDLLRTYGPPAATDFGWNENRDLFMSGKAAMSIDATVNGAFNENPTRSKVAGKVGYMPTPVHEGARLKGGHNSLITHQMYINHYSRHKDAAFLFISWATSRDVQMKSMEIAPNCGLTSRFAVGSPAFTEKFGAFKDSMLDALEDGNPGYLPVIPQGPLIFEKVGKALSRVLAGTNTADRAMREVNQELDALIPEHNAN